MLSYAFILCVCKARLVDTEKSQNTLIFGVEQISLSTYN